MRDRERNTEGENWGGMGVGTETERQTERACTPACVLAYVSESV